MASFVDRLIRRKPRSAERARERLQLVLIHDRTDLSPSMLEKLKDELIQVISRHVDIEAEAARIEMMREGREQRLIADIPLRHARHTRG
ncbi:MAG: cell division topological specificity factor MinE [Chloroflexota bacterium]